MQTYNEMSADSSHMIVCLNLTTRAIEVAVADDSGTAANAASNHLAVCADIRHPQASRYRLVMCASLQMVDS